MGSIACAVLHDLARERSVRKRKRNADWGDGGGEGERGRDGREREKKIDGGMGEEGVKNVGGMAVEWG